MIEDGEPGRGDEHDAVGRLLAEIRTRAAGPGDEDRRRSRLALATARWPALRVPGRGVALVGALALALVVVVVIARRPAGPTLAPSRLPVRNPVHAPPRVVATTTPRAVSTTMVSTTATAPSAIGADALLTLVPAGWRPRCRPAAVLAGAATAGVVCEPAGTVDRVELFRFANPATLADAVGRVGRGVAVGGSDARARCAVGVPENRAWRRPDAHNAAGRYICRRDAAGAQLAWSDTTRELLVQATRANGDLATLFAWWTSAPL
jgi:hypothetical protein